jgi:creatinine amidohydrolase/Fe(II)-dependent formamide hydrolase-like protein
MRILRSPHAERLTPIVLLLFACSIGHAQIFHVAEMNVEQIRALDKQKTVVILPGGILEEHGPHLPSFTDGYSNEWLAQRLGEAIAASGGWSVLVFPIIPLGHGGGNEIGGKPVFPGTYSIKRSTLRAIFMDLANELGEQGFRRVFITHGHGSPYHNLVLDQAGDYFRDTYGGFMVNLHGLEPSGGQLSKLKLEPIDLALPEHTKREIGLMDDHAGFEETSRLLYLRPHLVDPGHRILRPLTANRPVELFAIAGRRAGRAT